MMSSEITRGCVLRQPPMEKGMDNEDNGQCNPQALENTGFHVVLKLSVKKAPFKKGGL